MSMKKIILVMSVLLASCAYSPQQITIAPTVLMGDEPFGNSRVVEVTVEDQRSSKVIGTRGGAYPETSIITVANDIEAAIAKTAESALRQQGFVVDAQQPSNAVVKVVIETLQYENDKDSVTAKVNINVVIQLQVTVANKTHSGRYKSATSQPLIISPSTEKNALLINGLLTDTLQRGFSDPKIKAFLSNS